MTRKIGALLGLALLAGCVSVGDFQSMGSYERADRVCTGSKAYRDRKTRFETTLLAWGEYATLADQGYQIVETCQEMNVPSGQTTCRDNSIKDVYGNPVLGSDITCTQGTKRETQCTQTPVPVDADRMERKADELLDRLADYEAEDEQLLEECVERISRMAAEDAYYLYKADRDQ